MDKTILIRLTDKEYKIILKQSKQLNISFSRCVIINAIENIKKKEE